MKCLLSLIVFVTYLNAATVFYVKGEAKLENRKLAKGDTLKIGDEIATSSKSLIIISTKSGSKIKLDENSTLKLINIDSKNEKVELSFGQAFFNIVKNVNSDEKPKFKVKAQTTVLGVRGTEFFASYGSGKDLWMCVNEGLVSVKSNEEKNETLVKAGEGIVVKNGLKTSSPKPLAWTKKLNWSMNPTDKILENTIKIEEAYKDPLDYDYD